MTLEERLKDQEIHIKSVKENFCDKLGLPKDPLPTFEELGDKVLGRYKSNWDTFPGDLGGGSSQKAGRRIGKNLYLFSIWKGGMNLINYRGLLMDNKKGLITNYGDASNFIPHSGELSSNVYMYTNYLDEPWIFTSRSLYKYDRELNKSTFISTNPMSTNQIAGCITKKFVLAYGPNDGGCVFWKWLDEENNPIGPGTVYYKNSLFQHQPSGYNGEIYWDEENNKGIIATIYEPVSGGNSMNIVEFTIQKEVFTVIKVLNISRGNGRAWGANGPYECIIPFYNMYGEISVMNGVCYGNGTMSDFSYISGSEFRVSSIQASGYSFYDHERKCLDIPLKDMGSVIRLSGNGDYRLRFRI